MNLRPFLLLAAALAIPAFAQEPPPAAAPAPFATESAPAEDSSLLDPLPADPGMIDAPTLPPATDIGIQMPRLTTRPPKEEDEEAKKKKEDLPAASIEDRVKFRRARTKALSDPRIIDAAQRAADATTDPEKRAALDEYYKLMFAKVRKLEPGVELMVVAAEEQVFRRLDPITAQEIDKRERAERKSAKMAGENAKASPAPPPAAR